MSGRRAAFVATLALASILVAACSAGVAASPPNAGGAASNQPASQTADPEDSQSAESQAVASQPAESPAAESQAAGGQAPSNLCAIWTSAQVTAAVGGPSGAGVPQNDGQMCLWGDQATGANASISIDAGQGFAATCGAPGVMKVDGIGDGACFLLGGNLGTSLEFQKGGQGYAVAVQKPQVSVDWVEAAEKTLALEAVAKL